MIKLYYNVTAFVQIFVYTFKKVTSLASSMRLQVYQVIIDLALDSHQHALLCVVVDSLVLRNEVSVLFP